MAHHTSHYITLPIRVANDTNPANKIQSFTTKLSSDFELQDDWELGLAEICFTKTWPTINIKKPFEFLVYSKELPNFTKIMKFDNIEIDIKNYRTIESILEKIEEKFDQCFVKDGEDLYIKGYREKTVYKKPKYIIKNDLIEEEPGLLGNETIGFEKFFVRFDQILGNILGIDYYYITDLAYNTFNRYSKLLPELYEYVKIENIIAKSKADIDRNIDKLYVTCDIIKNSYYNTRNSNILRLVDVPDVKFGEKVLHIYDNIYYFPLNKHLFKDIKIEMFLDDSIDNNYCPFKFGEAYVILHLRKISKIVNITVENTPESKPEEPKNRPEIESARPWEQ